jgi:hypothetical protein
MKRASIIMLCLFAALVSTAALAQMKVPEGRPASTPAQLVEAYDSLADTIIAVKKTEWNLVHSILAMTYSHAQGTVAEAKAKIKAGKDARADIEKLAALVSQLGNEGDAAVAGVRKRLVDAGAHHHHHHHAKKDEEPTHDKGFVIVTREAKRGLLEAAGRIGRMAGSPDAAALDAEWGKVQSLFQSLHKGVGG